LVYRILVITYYDFKTYRNMEKTYDFKPESYQMKKKVLSMCDI